MGEMASYLNRSMSVMSNGSMAKGDVATESPLKIFVIAKKKINDIFGEIGEYVGDSLKFLNDVKGETAKAIEDQRAEAAKFKGRITGIREVLARDHMKVAFFGRTSNGKSTVINAMLKDKILPSGIGHTTNCFLQVEGSDNAEAFLMTEDSGERQSVESVGQLAHALCTEKLSESALVRIFWPKEKCPLLRDDVVLVDSPGIDVSPNLDEWIDKHCLDADVFVLVANAESTLMVTEKNFFHKVSARLSKPNIFILNNRWDASASEPEFLEQVRKQHMDRNTSFLVEELNVVTPQQADDRVFFVSAKEVLQARLKIHQGQSVQAGTFADGFQARYFEFEDFERKFEECISKSAVKTKFEQHTQRGKAIASDLRSVMDNVHQKAQILKVEKTTLRNEHCSRLDFTEKRLAQLTLEMKCKITAMVEDVEQKVSGALSEEIRRLHVLVDEFNSPFHPDQIVMNVYKKELHGYVEQGLGSNLRGRLSTALTLSMETTQKEMTERMAQLLPPEHEHHMRSVVPRRDFEVLYRLNCDNLCADFQEDVQFRFSLGITTMIDRFTGRRTTKWPYFTRSDQVPPSLPMTPVTPSVERSLVQSSVEDISLVSKMALAAVSQQGTVGIVVLGGVLVRAIGWRVIFLTGSIYGLLYLYERLTWTSGAKERAFKQQYVEHATNKLRLIVDLTSANCSHQVQQELSSTFARLCHLVDEAKIEMESQIQDLDRDVRGLEETANMAKILRNKAGYLISELDTFIHQYLMHSP